MKIEVKRFQELSIDELYDLLQLRSQVFVVEQDCVYQDLDGKDQKAIHVLGKQDGVIVAYTRVFAPGHYFEEASIGRVVVAEPYRKFGYGKDIMKASVAHISTNYPEVNIKLSAQCYLTRFYNELGFTEVGESYLEDGIPHIAMVRSRQKA
jgi:ElaA protein